MFGKSSWERWRPQGNAALAVLAASQGQGGGSVAAGDVAEDRVRYVSSRGDDASGDGSYSKPFRTYRAAADDLGEASSLDDFEALRVIRTRGILAEYDQPDIDLPTGRWVFELGPSCVVPRVRFDPLDSKRFASALAPGLTFVGTSIFDVAAPIIQGSVSSTTAVEIDVDPGDPVSNVILSFERCRVFGDVVDMSGALGGTLQAMQAVFIGVVDLPAWIFTAVICAIGNTFNVGQLGAVRTCFFYGNVNVSSGHAAAVVDSQNGLWGCSFDVPAIVQVLDGNYITLDELTVRSCVNAGVTFATGGACIMGERRQGNGDLVTIPPGTETDQEVWVDVQGQDNPLRSPHWGSKAFPFATLQFALDALGAGSAVPAANKDEYLSEVVINLGPGEHDAPLAPSINIGTKALVRIKMHNASIIKPIYWTCLASLKYGQPRTPTLELFQVEGSVEHIGATNRVLGDGNQSVIQQTAVGDIGNGRLRAAGVRFNGTIQQDGTYLGSGVILNLDFINCQVAGAAPDIDCPTALMNLVNVTVAGLTTAQGLTFGLERCTFTGSMVFSASAGSPAPSSGRGYISDCAFTAGAGKSITVPAGAAVCLDSASNAALKNAGWAVHPATAVVELRHDAVAIIPT